MAETKEQSIEYLRKLLVEWYSKILGFESNYALNKPNKMFGKIQNKLIVKRIKN